MKSPIKPARHPKNRYLVGVDEVGRGPIAGPVAVGAFVFLNQSAAKLFRGVKESKQLSEKQREEWFARILEAQKAGHVDFCVTFKSERVIDRRGLTYAIKSALEASLNGLSLEPSACKVLLDGGLKAPAIYANQRTIIKGDEKKKVIALASICAKVLRDRKMNALAKKHPGYGFDKHKGYGTRAHYLAVNRLGMLPVHRSSFFKNRQVRPVNPA